jgi:hypothetical protein
MTTPAAFIGFILTLITTIISLKVSWAMIARLWLLPRLIIVMWRIAHLWVEMWSVLLF